MEKERILFKNWLLPYVLVAPQLVLTVVFFLWPAVQALYQSVMGSDPFGIRLRFVGFRNFITLFNDPYYWNSVRLSFAFSAQVALFSMAIGLFLAIMAHRPLPQAKIYEVLLIWPYALSPAVAAVLWVFMFQPSIGIVTRFLRSLGVLWDYTLNGRQAFLLVVLVACWKQVSYNFIFFLAGLQAIPKAILEAASVDGASPWQAFRAILFPLLSPTTFFLLVMNTVFAFFDTFGIIDALTKGGPGKATETMAYKLFVDGFRHFAISSSAAQSVVLMGLVIVLTGLQFRFVQRRVHYE